MIGHYSNQMINRNYLYSHIFSSLERKTLKKKCIPSIGQVQVRCTLL